MTGAQRGVIRLIVASPDGRRVLARPNGLAGWTLPAVAVDLPFGGWDDDVRRRAAAVVGAPVTPERAVDDGCWSVVLGGRAPATGRTWIGLDEVDRLGADAEVVRRWASARGERPPG